MAIVCSECGKPIEKMHSGRVDIQRGDYKFTLNGIHYGVCCGQKQYLPEDNKMMLVIKAQMDKAFKARMGGVK